MTRSFAATKQNDFQLNMAGNLSLLSAAAAVTQAAKHAMQTRRDEMIYDMPDGIPFEILTWAGTPDLAQFEAAGRARLRQVDGVQDIISFNASMVGDVLQYVAVIRTTFGEVSING